MNAVGKAVSGSRISTDAERWDALSRRDRDADGVFYYAVKTTGVYCRPHCGSRLPRRENVRFFSTILQAEQAGYRACKRCRPTDQSANSAHAEVIATACRIIEASSADSNVPGLGALATAAGLSRFHFHRVFKSIAGVTPKAYAAAYRARRVREELARGQSVTASIYAAGYNSNGRFYEKSSALLGMTPKAYKSGGDGATIRFAVGQCSLGAILVAATEMGVCCILLGDDPRALVRDLQDRFSKAQIVGGDRSFEKTVASVIAFVDQPALGWALPLDLRGTAFQQRVWQALREISSGQTASYTQIAERVGAPKAVRAVAAACAANPIAVVVPCHRVVRIGGALAGYRWGIARKAALLKRERGQD